MAGLPSAVLRRSGLLTRLNSDGFDRQATGGAGFFAEARLGLALATTRFVVFPAAFLALGRALAAFFFWTFDDCFLRLAIAGPLS